MVRLHEGGPFDGIDGHDLMLAAFHREGGQMEQRRRAAQGQEGQAGNLLFLDDKSIGSGGLRRLQGGENEGMPERDRGLG